MARRKYIAPITKYYMDKYERPSDVVTYHISELPQKEQERIAQMFEDVQKRLKWDTRRK